MRFVETVDKINGLPVGFKEVEYLQSTGEQYIDTGIAGSSTLRIEMNGQKSGASFGVYFGAGTGNNRIQAIYINNYNSARIGNVTNTQLGSDTKKFNIVVDTLNKNVIYNGTTYPFAYTSALTTLNIFIFARNEGGSFADKASAKCWSFKVWDNNALVRDFIPCLDVAGKPCMYDLVGKKAYYNIGTGEFTYGRKIIPVEYLESTGTQYIDTGYYPNNNTKYNLKTQFLNPTTTQEYKGIIGVSVAPNDRCGMGFYNGKIRQQFGSGAAVYGGNYNDSSYIGFNNATVYECSRNGFYIEGTLNWTPTKDFTGTSSVTAWLFNTHAEAVYSGTPQKLFYCKIYDNNILVRNYIPAIDESGIAFMFDQVTHAIFDNTGTGEFIYGSPVASNKGKIRFPVTQHEKSRLPLGFKEVEYLESSEAQWIKTDYTLTSSTKIDILFSPNQQTRLNLWVIGSRVEENKLTGIRISSDTIIDCFINTTNSPHITSSNVGNKYRAVLDGKWTVNDTQGTSITPSAGLSPLTLFSYNSSTTENTYTSSALCACKIYYCKIWDNEILVRDYIPCLDNNGIPCMYDLVSGQPFYNQGTGADFSYGREIHYVECLESTGTQYINTGYAFQDDFSWEIDFDGITKGATLFGGRTSTVRTAILYQKSEAQGTETTCPIAGMTGDQTPFQLVDLSTGKHTVKMSVAQNRGSVWVDGLQVYDEQAFTGTYISGTTQALFADNFGTSVSEYVSSKVYALKMWQDLIIVRDYLPAIDENNVGFMFDRVTHTIFDNAGTGEFLYGNLLKQNKIRIVIPHPIPLIYKPVEYLESTGTQYINTGINASGNISFVLSSTQDGFDYNSGTVRFGSKVSEGNGQLAILTAGSNTFRIDYGTGSQSQTNWTPAATKKVSTFNLNANAHTITMEYIDNTSESHTWDSSIASFSSTYPLLIFAYSNGSTKYYASSMKVTCCKIWDGSTLVRNLVPVIRRADEKPGLYCKVTKQFFTNAGTGEFLYG